MATVVGVFSKKQGAERAIRALKDEGFNEDEIGIAAKDDRRDDQGAKGRGRSDFEAGGRMGVAAPDIAEGTTWGGALGGLAGLLAGVGALAIPGIGPIVAAGPLAAALSGAVAGGVAGGLLDLGIPEQEGRRFEQDVKEGKVLAVVKTEGERLEKAESVLRESGADEVKRFERSVGR